MDYKELLKKYWFVGLIGVVLIVFIVVYAIDASKNQETIVQSKQVDGKYAVYSVDGDYVFADDFYQSMFEKIGMNCELNAFRRAVVNDAYQTTTEMQDMSAQFASYYYQMYGESIIYELEQMGYTNGYEDLMQLYIDDVKAQQLTNDYMNKDYLNTRLDDLINDYNETNSPRIIYHILVKVADITTNTNEDGTTTYTANPTAEEQEKLNTILEELKTKDFKEVAKQYSDDGSAQDGGYIGVISYANSSNYYEIFSTTSMTLTDDQVSDVITSQAGYHIIWDAGSTNDLLFEDDSYKTEILNLDPTIEIRSLYDKANELGYEIIDQKLVTYFDSILNPKKPETDDVDKGTVVEDITPTNTESEDAQ